MEEELKTMVTRIIRSENEKKPVMLPDDTSLLKELSMKPRDRYKFIRTIGIGGMKAVLLVYDSDTNRNVALAMMPDIKERSKEDVAKFIISSIIELLNWKKPCVIIIYYKIYSIICNR